MLATSPIRTLNPRCLCELNSILRRGEHYLSGLMDWAVEHDCPCDESSICTFAALGGHLGVLRWLWEKDFFWDWTTTAAAAEGGHLEVLQWLREHGCEWNEATCAYAAYGGHLDVLKWAREHDCSWDEETRECAVLNGDPEVLRWLVEHGAP